MEFRLHAPNLDRFARVAHEANRLRPSFRSSAYRENTLHENTCGG